jgi:hypothetical protein
MSFAPKQPQPPLSAAVRSTQPQPPSPVAAKPAQQPPNPLTEMVHTTYKQLASAAVDLNAASDDLGKPIYACEASLKKLNLGIPAWVELSGADSGGRWWDRSLGYTKLKDRWGIALRTREGRHGDDGSDEEELWPFNDAPRWMRIEAVTKLPDLLEELLRQAKATTQQIKKKIAHANELAGAIGAADESRLVEGK